MRKTASRISSKPIRSSGVGSIIHGRLHLVVAKKTRLAGRSHLSREWGKRLRELRERVVEAADGIGKTGGAGGLGWSNTNEGKVIAAAFLDAHNHLVEQVRVLAAKPLPEPVKTVPAAGKKG